MKKLHLFVVALLFAVAASFLPMRAGAQGTGQFVVALDAGHGGKDAGACRAGVKEKDINLKIALKVGKLIESNCKGVKVIYTRTTDKFVELYRRTQIANNAGANLFISFHVNASTQSGPAGLETFYFGKGGGSQSVAAKENSVVNEFEGKNLKIYEEMDLNSAEGIAIFELEMKDALDKAAKMARLTQRHLSSGNTSLKSRGVSRDNFCVLRTAAMPSILVEMGFISNPRDRGYITSGTGQDKISRAIYKAFCEYYADCTAGLSGSGGRQVEPAPEPETEPAAPANENNAAPAQAQAGGPIVYKVQVLASERKLADNDRSLKGYKCSYYQEGGLYKYTYGETTNLQEAKALRNKLAKQFKTPFVVKFCNGQKVN